MVMYVVGHLARGRPRGESIEHGGVPVIPVASWTSWGIHGTRGVIHLKKKEREKLEMGPNRGLEGSKMILMGLKMGHMGHLVVFRGPNSRIGNFRNFSVSQILREINFGEKVQKLLFVKF